jgi:predicted transcriptional regulator
MSTEVRTETSPTQRRQELIEKYWAGDMARKVYLLRRQRKAILEHCQRIAVQQAAVFDPISVKPETTLKEAAELMLRWHVGGLLVADDQSRLVGMITYTDLLREYVGREEDH